VEGYIKNFSRQFRLNFSVDLANSTLGFAANSFYDDIRCCTVAPIGTLRTGSKEIAAPVSIKNFMPVFTQCTT